MIPLRLKGSFVHLASVGPYREFRKGLQEPKETQSRLLQEILHTHRDTDFVRDHDFAGVSSFEEFQKRVPIQSYETLSPYLERVENGDRRALLPDNTKVFMFGLTSGSTGRPKRIPVTQEYLRRFRGTHRLWSKFCTRDHPTAARGNFFAFTSSWRETATADGTPCGAVTGLVAELQPRWVKRFLTLPAALVSVEDTEVREAAAMRHALSHPISFLTAANPSSLLRFARRLDDEGETALASLADEPFPFRNRLPEGYRNHPDFRPQPKRAIEMRSRIDRAGKLDPTVLWPELALLSCWTGGTLTPYLDRLRPFFPGVPIRDPGLLASEGRFTIPFEDETASGIPDLGGVVFEFYPADGESEVPVGNAEPLALLEDLEVGKRYFMVFTAPWGLYRYHIDDIVEVTGKWEGVPMLRFVRKGSGFSSITGEKLAEDQVVAATEGLSPAFLASHGGDLILAPKWGDPPGYALILEKREDDRDDELLRVAEDLDRRLGELNLEYASKRKTLRLAPIRPVLVERGTFDRLRAEEIAKAGGRGEQYKLKRIRSDYDFLDTLGSRREIEGTIPANELVTRG